MRERRYLNKSEEFGSNVDNFLNFKTASEVTLIEDASEIHIAISNLFQLVLLANQKNRTGWNFGRSIIHKKTGKTYRFFKDNLIN